MKTWICMLMLLVLPAAFAAEGEADPDAQDKLKSVVKKYMEMKGKPRPGVVVEIAEFVDKERTAVTLAETEIIEAIKKADIPVLAEGKPQFIIYGAVESNWGGEQIAFGKTVSVYEATLTLKVIDTKDGTVIHTALAQVRKVNTSAERAAREAMREAGGTVAKDVVKVLNERMQNAR